MRSDTPPPPAMDDDLDDDLGPLNMDEIEVIDDAELDFDDEDNDDENEYLTEEDEGIELTTRSDAQISFSKHDGPVFCCDLDHTNGKLAVSGGQDDMAYVWDATNGEVLFECTGHKDSVIHVGFNHDSTLVFTADMSGVIKVWKTDTKEKLVEYETSDLGWAEWHRLANVLLVGNSSGEAWMFKVPSDECKIFQTYGQANSSGKILPDGKRAIMGYEDGCIRIWDLKNVSVAHTINDATAHSSGITCIDCHPENILAMTGSTDSTAKIINCNTGKVVSTFQCENEVDEGNDENDRNTVEAVAFCSHQPIAATGTVNGDIAVWDVPTQTQRYIWKQEAGVVKLFWDPSAPLVYAAGIDGILRLWDGRSGKLEQQWLGHKDSILDFSVSQDSNTVLTSSEDGTCNIYSLRRNNVG